MDAGCEIQEVTNNNLMKQLALAVRSIQWSYAIFWSISSKNSGLLEWVDGYYNGDIKTRKTVQAGEVNADQQGLQRSEQLRELYESLLAGESNPHARRPSAALSPEDLTDAEWYYLVCMSFTFTIGQGLPGRTLKKNQTIWLCNAHQAESKVFTRSLLAKSASIQTVVCFPLIGGVIEVGTTEPVPEDLSLVQRMQTSLLEIPHPVVDKISSYVSEIAANDKDIISPKSDHDMFETSPGPIAETEDVTIHSPDNSSNGFETNKLVEDSYIIEGMYGEASQVQSCHLVDDDIGSQVHISTHSGDSISQVKGKAGKNPVISDGEKIDDGCLNDIQECNQERISLDPQKEDIHYHSILSNLLKSSHQLILGPYFRNRNRDSIFTSWKKDALLGVQKPQTGTPQNLLKKVLLEVAKMHEGTFIRNDNKKGENLSHQEVDKDEGNSFLSEQLRGEKINEKFTVLSSLVPTDGKADKASILDSTIEYLKELKRRLGELGSYQEVVPKTRRKHQDASERTSDNYGSNRVESGKKAAHSNRRKAGGMEDTQPPCKRNLSRDSASDDDMSVYVVDKGIIMIEMKIPSRDGVLVQIMEVMSNFHLDSLDIQSTNSRGVLSVTIKSKPKGSKVPSVGKIKEALQRVIQYC